jgi:regulator of sirC expression with transglutaminase-like and TPR domain
VASVTTVTDHPSDPVAEFAELVARGDPPLGRALALVAATGRPEVRPDAVVAALDDLAARAATAVPAPADPGTVCAALFGPLGLRGNRADYYEPANSLLDRVLERRLGIPITLSVVAIEVGRRLGTAMVGVGMPGHFVVRDATDVDAFFDPFDAGRPLGRDGCRSVFRELHGESTPFSETYLDPTAGLDVVVRVLNNLRAAHLRAGDRAGLLNALRLQAVLPGAGVPERRQLAGVLSAEGRFVEASDLYDELASADPARADDHRAAALRLRANLN